MDEPFERLQEQQGQVLLERMDRMIERLEQIEAELDEIIDSKR